MAPRSRRVTSRRDERDYKIDWPGGGFCGNIVGADSFSKTKKGHISGITTDDATHHDTSQLAAG